MKGTYRFYQDGKLIAEQENLITTEGKKAILRYLAGHSGGFVRSLAVGTGTTAAALGDTKLLFEVARANVAVTSPDYTTQKLTFKATLPQQSKFAIWEIGALTVSENELNGRMLLTFDSADELWSAGAFQTDTSRIGGDSLRLTPATSATTTATLSDVFLDTADYKDNDKFSLAYIPNNAFLSSLTVRFKTDASNYYSYAIPTLTAGYKIATWTKAAMTKTGTPSWDNITSVDIIAVSTAGGSASVDLDGLRIDYSVVPNTEYALVSRTVLGAAVIKTDVSQMDIEYTLDVTI